MKNISFSSRINRCCRKSFILDYVQKWFQMNDQRKFQQALDGIHSTTVDPKRIHDCRPSHWQSKNLNHQQTEQRSHRHDAQWPSLKLFQKMNMFLFQSIERFYTKGSALFSEIIYINTSIIGTSDYLISINWVLKGKYCEAMRFWFKT